MKKNLLISGGLIFLIAFAPAAWSKQTPTDSERTMVFISDLHMGIGRDDNCKWYPTEDFRWPVALRHFLDYISEKGNNQVDLVIVGDFLELWQAPPDVSCEGVNADYGCTEAEMIKIVNTVIRAHKVEFSDFARFASKGTNRIYVIPGNHDAALLIPSVWNPVERALGANGGFIKLVESGVWTSADGRILAEHGHQIGWDPNRYGEWPKIVKEFSGQLYVRRPWGELFVQKLFNTEEEQYPLIDNLSPSSAGARHRMAGRGIAKSAGDLARFLKFNLLETSLSQKIRVLKEEKRNGSAPRWDLAQARSMGHELFLFALPSDDEFAELITTDDVLKHEMDTLTRDKAAMPDEEIEALCDQLAQRKHGKLCRKPTLGGLIESVVNSRKRIVRPYVKEKWENEHRVRNFVYGHTHAFETEWKAKVNSLLNINVLNDGAFQRVVDDDKFIAEAQEQSLKPSQAMEKLSLTELPACYTFVRMVNQNGELKRELSAWYMPEDVQQGKVVGICDSRCADVGHGCK